MIPIFTDRAYEEFDKIVSKYDLKNVKSKIREKVPVLVERFSRKLFNKEIMDEDFVVFLQQNTDLPQNSAKNIVTDIRKNIIPFIELFSEENFNTSANNNLQNKIKNPLEIEKILSKTEETTFKKPPESILPADIQEPKKTLKKTKFIEKPIKKTAEKSTQSDTYRESIE